MSDPAIHAIDAPTATLQAWRERGAERLDPVRFRLLDALARRTEAQQGAPRALLEARLAARMADFRHAHASVFDAAGEHGPLRAASRTDTAASGDTSSPTATETLRGLVERLQAHAARRPAAGPLPTDGPGELKAVGQLRETWTRLNTERLLAQAEALVPEQAGPLNTERLIHRSLQLFHALSPGYLQHFLAHAETMTWLERALTPVALNGAHRRRPTSGS